jgi:quercetin dioxygenase-like cupin family protein
VVDSRPAALSIREQELSFHGKRFDRPKGRRHLQKAETMPLSLRKAILTAVLIAGVAAVVSVAPKTANTAQEGPVAAVCLLPGDMAWERDPHVHGLETAVLFGNPSVAGPYVQRIKFPAGFRLPPHSHPNEGRMVTVLSGTLYFAFGDRFDQAKLRALPAGSFFLEPKDVPHYALTKEEVVLQLNAVGPAGTKHVTAASESPQKNRKRGQFPTNLRSVPAGTARRVLRTNGDCPPYPCRRY